MHLMIEKEEHKGRSINRTTKGYAPAPTKAWLDGWLSCNNVYAFRLLFKLLELTPHIDSHCWKKGVLEVSSVELTQMLGWSRNTLYKTLQVLIDDGIITCVANRGRENLTTITFTDYDGMLKCSRDEQLNALKCSRDEQLNALKCSPGEQHIVPSISTINSTPCVGVVGQSFDVPHKRVADLHPCQEDNPDLDKLLDKFAY